MGFKSIPGKIISSGRKAILENFLPTPPDREIIEKVFAPHSPLIGINKHMAEIVEILRGYGINPETAAGRRSR